MKTHYTSGWLKMEHYSRTLGTIAESNKEF